MSCLLCFIAAQCFNLQCRFVCFDANIAAEVVKLVDMHVSGACASRCAGSSPAFGTTKNKNAP